MKCICGRASLRQIIFNKLTNRAVPSKHELHELHVLLGFCTEFYLMFNISVLTLTEDDDNNYHLTKVRVYWKWDLKRFNTLSDSYKESLLLWP